MATRFSVFKNVTMQVYDSLGGLHLPMTWKNGHSMTCLSVVFVCIFPNWV